MVTFRVPYHIISYLSMIGHGFCRTQTIALEEEERPWVVEIDKEAVAGMEEGEERWAKPCIFRIPEFAKILNLKAFTPQVVSLGPYHHGAQHLLPLEPHKRRALHHFLRRSGRPLIDFVRAMEPHLETLQDSYEPLDRKWRDDPQAFLRLMIVDGCFMLEVLHLDPCSLPKAAAAAVAQQKERSAGDYASNDPFFSQHGMLRKMPYIRRDMLMLENQLPLLVLKILLDVAAAAITTPNINDNTDIRPHLCKPDNLAINNLVLHFCSDAKAKADTGCCLGLHVLDLFRQSTISKLPSYSIKRDPPPQPGRYSQGVIVRSAVELSEAGVHFKASPSSSLKDISFKRGVLYLPPIVVDDATECTFLNMVAMEHQQAGMGSEVTCYVAFMDEIIDSASDVRLLQREEIIHNAMGSNKAVAELFNTMAREVTLNPESHLVEVRSSMNAYCRRRWPKWRANLMHTYFKSPWAYFSVAAATLVIVLTILQTAYSIKQSYSSDSENRSLSSSH